MPEVENRKGIFVSAVLPVCAVPAGVLLTIHNLQKSWQQLKLKVSNQSFSDPASIIHSQPEKRFMEQVIALIHQTISSHIALRGNHYKT